MSLGVRGQSRALLEHLRSGKSITSKEAFELYGITRLAVHIFVFRQHGFVINTEIKQGVTRFGTPCHWAVYKLLKDIEG